jgi:2-keto-4-pentenoate hydratase/2-oxohepta-3-ene-1,7-dioic acid hydratase in catechol pathway
LPLRPKGFETFVSIGPWIATRDEIPDPHRLAMNLWIDGELRQWPRALIG